MSIKIDTNSAREKLTTLDQGDEITVIDGRGRTYEAEINHSVTEEDSDIWLQIPDDVAWSDITSGGSNDSQLPRITINGETESRPLIRYPAATNPSHSANTNRTVDLVAVEIDGKRYEIFDFNRDHHDWFELIEPEIDTRDVSEVSSGELEQVARQHLEQVAREVDMDVDLSGVDIDANRRLKGCHGKANGERVSLSLHSLERNGWRNLMMTTRHELIHVWQHQNLTKFDPHGESFEQWMDVLDVKKKWGTVIDPKWQIRCPNGHLLETYHRRTKTLWQALDGILCCDRCGKETAGELEVYRDGELIEKDEYRDFDDDGDDVDISEQEKRIFLYSESEDRPDSKRNPSEFEWYPVQYDITDFVGIGEKTAAKLIDHVEKIDDLVDDNGLPAVVTDAVSPQYRDAFEEEVLGKYEEVLEKRDGDLETFRRLKRDDEKSWSRKYEKIDGIGKLGEMLRRLLQSTGHRVEIELTNGDVFSGEVLGDGRASPHQFELKLREEDVDIEGTIHVSFSTNPVQRPVVTHLSDSDFHWGIRLGLVERVDVK